MALSITSLAPGVTVLIGWPRQEPLLALVARLALVGNVQIVVGGNRFDAHALARLVRQHTVALDETLGRVGQMRPFTATQTAKIIADLTPDAPIVVLDLLDTFYDESISDAESVRLLRLAVARLRLLGRETAVLITVRQPPTGQRAGLVKLVRGAADRVYLHERPARWGQSRLF